MNDVYVVIMAGGSGERFWPWSRKKLPKQLLPVVSKKSMLQETVARLTGITSKDRIIVVTNKEQKRGVAGQIPFIPKKNIIAEPVSKNTASCIAVAAALIGRKNPRAVMAVLPADHVITSVTRFKKTLTEAIAIARQKDVLVTLGIRPDKPHTGYGYIRKGRKLDRRLYRIDRFTEKPDLARAKKYIAGGRYLWNSGMFVWRVDTITEEIKRYLPRLYRLCQREKDIETIYRKAANISIDYGVMEKTDKAVVYEVDFRWDDVGSWAALMKYLPKDKKGNTSRGDVLLYDVKNSIVFTDGPLVSVMGLDNVIAVAAGNAVLVCSRDKAEEVKKIVNIIKKGGKEGKYL